MTSLRLLLPVTLAFGGFSGALAADHHGATAQPSEARAV
jgi:hypothetical protein